MTAKPELALGRYRHYKGNEYQVIDLARHSETCEWLVVYRPLYGEGGLWVRPFAMFVENVEINGVVQARFAKIAD
ncbi:DUF1653 domain-containing protein [Chitinibacter sp. SCUT-21]|uniref:DUF1653 domain-containing protein n=1 Tax=Chitinibacter sp. SCUT-21 TaxID=2970891 RepID=UPI0035A6232C